MAKFKTASISTGTKTSKLTKTGQYSGITKSMLPSVTPKKEVFKLAPNSDGTNRVVQNKETILERFEPVRARGWRTSGDAANPGFTYGDPKIYNKTGEGGFITTSSESIWSGKETTGKTAVRDVTKDRNDTIKWSQSKIKELESGDLSRYEFEPGTNVKEAVKRIIAGYKDYINQKKAEIFKVRTFSPRQLDNAWGKRFR